jgi:predicted TIM-barrel fold metal-dependent hydrolase
MAQYEDIPLIDSHTHCHNQAEATVLERAAERLGLKAFTVCGICYAGGRSTVANPLALQLKIANPGRVYACGGLFYKLPGRKLTGGDLVAQARRLGELGFDGVKMIQGKPTAYKAIGIPLNDPVYRDYYAYLQAERVPVVFHVADPEEFWDREKIPAHFLKMGWLYDGSFPAKEQLYAEIDDVLGRFSRLRVVFAHFYFLSADIERAGRFLDAHPTVSFDITPGMEMYGNFTAKADEWSDFFRRYKDRIVFGTDNTCPVDDGTLNWAVDKINCMRRFLATKDEFVFDNYEVRGLGLGCDVLERIFHLNFEALFGKRPKEVDPSVAVDYCGELTRLADGMPEKDEVVRSLNEISERIRSATG